jgi:hypothetical protein
MTNIDLTALTVEQMRHLDSVDFREIVDADLKSRAPSSRVRRDIPNWVSMALRNEFLEQWLAALRQMLASADGILEMRANEFAQAEAALTGRSLRGDRQADIELADLKADYHRSRAGTLRFRSAVTEALPEAERLMSSRAKTLEDAIRAHRSSLLQDPDFEPSTQDEELWALVVSDGNGRS